MTLKTFVATTLIALPGFAMAQGTAAPDCTLPENAALQACLNTGALDNIDNIATLALPLVAVAGIGIFSGIGGGNSGGNGGGGNGNGNGGGGTPGTPNTTN